MHLKCLYTCSKAYQKHAELWPPPRILDGSTDFGQVLEVQMWIMLSCPDQPMVSALSQDDHIHSFLADYSVLSAKEVSSGT